MQQCSEGSLLVEEREAAEKGVVPGDKRGGRGREREREKDGGGERQRQRKRQQLGSPTFLKERSEHAQEVLLVTAAEDVPSWDPKGRPEQMPKY